MGKARAAFDKATDIAGAVSVGTGYGITKTLVLSAFATAAAVAADLDVTMTGLIGVIAGVEAITAFKAGYDAIGGNHAPPADRLKSAPFKIGRALGAGAAFLLAVTVPSDDTIIIVPPEAFEYPEPREGGMPEMPAKPEKNAIRYNI